MKRIAVREDEKCMRDQMREYLEDLEPVFQADYYESGNALLDAGIFYDVIFLDIDMRGLTGIDTARIQCEETGGEYRVSIMLPKKEEL